MSIPAKLGKYEIRRELGAGAMGVVYEGWDPGIARRVAIKTVKGEQLAGAEAEQTLQRFQHEAQAAGRLSHPNIVQIYEFGKDQSSADGSGDTSFIAMEFIEGRELKDTFDKDERFKLPEIVRIMKELLAALGHAHKNGIVHRDVKPANIILLADGTVKVADFGIARIESSSLTQAGSVLGTPSYMSPEQFMGQTVDGRSDLFSAGVILYQFLTGEKPFTGSVTTIMHKVLKEEPPAPSDLNVQVPHAFDALMKKALAKRPDERFQSAQEFAAAIEAAAAGQQAAEATLINAGDATVTGATLTGKAAATAVPPVPGGLPSVTPAAAPGRSASALAIAAGVAAIAVGASAWLMLGRDHESATGPAAAQQAATPQTTVSPAPTLAAAPGTAIITALGLADPADPRYAADHGLLVADLREDAKRQLIEKAAALYVDDQSLTKHYGLLQTRLLARGGEFIQTIEESEPLRTPDGLMSLTAKATVKVRAVQKSLNQMSREERIDFIRNNGDPRIAVAITAHSAQGSVADANAPAQRSPIAENLLKERIQSFGFRLWNDDAAQGADFSVTGEARFKKLSAKLEASGIVIEKFVLSSWTVKCTDKKSGEEIYYNNHIPEKQSWATEEQALRDVGRLIGEEFSKSFFLQHFNFTGQKITLNFKGLPSADMAKSLQRELTGMRPVLAVAPRTAAAGELRFDAELSGGSGDVIDLVGNAIVKPLNRKLGKTCFSMSSASGGEATLAFDAACADAATIGRLDGLPPAALFDAPKARREAVIRSPEKMRKLSI